MVSSGPPITASPPPPRLGDGALVERQVLGWRDAVPAQGARLEVLARVPNHPQQRVVGIQNPPIQVAKADADDVRVDHAAETLLAGSQRCLGILAGGDVAGDAANATDTACPLDREHGHGDPDVAAVLASTQGL